MTPIYTLEASHITQLHTLYQSEWWSKGRSLEDTKRVVQGSQVCIGLVDDQGDLKAFARVLTDYTFKAVIFDVIVAQDCRGQGLGDRLMALIMEHPDLETVQFLELYCQPDMEPFYNAYGFSAEVGGVRLMRRSRR